MADKEMGVSPAQVEKCLKGIDYPADKEMLRSYAQRECGDDDQVMGAIDDLPDWDYEKSTDVTKALGDIE